MAKLIVSLQAQADEAYIIRDLARKAGRPVAEKYTASIDELLVRLIAFPESGAPRPSIGKRVRIGVIWPYVVLSEYTPATDTVTILRIVHGRRKITGKMLLSKTDS